MNEIEFNIKTSKGENVSFHVPLCGSSFFYFPEKPYKENPEFVNCLVIGSGGTIGAQVIIRVQPRGHKNSLIFPHINVDYAYWDEKRQKRIRENDIKTLKIGEWVEVEMKNKKTGEIKTSKISLGSINFMGASDGVS